jgi:hypothetical protein
MMTQNMKFGSSTCLLLVVQLVSGSAYAQPSGAESVSSTGPISGYMDFHFNKTEAEDGVLDFHRFVLIVNHSLL